MKTSEIHIWTFRLGLIFISSLIFSVFSHKIGRSSSGRHGHHHNQAEEYHHKHHHYHNQQRLYQTSKAEEESTPFSSSSSSSSDYILYNECLGSKKCEESSSGCLCYPPEPKSNKRICGSDGRLYRSHCDLQRRACLTKSHIFVNHSCLLPPLSKPSNKNLLDNNNNSSLSKETSNQNPREIKEDFKSTSDLHDLKNHDLEPRGQFQNDQMGNLCTSEEFEIFRNKLFQLKKEDLSELFLIDKKKLEFEGRYWSEMVGDGPEGDKDQLLRLIFRIMDINSDDLLHYSELYQLDTGNVLWKLNSSKCQFRDFLLFDDTNRDGGIHLTEFYSGFSHLYGVTMISLEKALETVELVVNIGEDVELKCDVYGSPPTPIFWRFPDHFSQKNSQHIQLQLDGTLILTNVQISQEGDYSCQSVRNEEVVQTHKIRFRVPPVVLIFPKLVMEYPSPNKIITFECELEHLNLPTNYSDPVTWSWFHNNETILINETEVVSSKNNYKNYKIETFANGTSRCLLSSISSEHMGTFTCQAANSFGNGSDSATMIILNHSWMEKG